MIQITAQMRVLVAIEPVDGRKGIDSLARLCQEKLAEDPFSGCVFVFRSRSGTAIRLLSYDGQGYWLAQKRLSKGRFVWWPEGSEAAKPSAAGARSAHSRARFRARWIRQVAYRGARATRSPRYLRSARRERVRHASDGPHSRNAGLHEQRQFAGRSTIGRRPTSLIVVGPGIVVTNPVALSRLVVNRSLFLCTTALIVSPEPGCGALFRQKGRFQLPQTDPTLSNPRQVGRGSWAAGVLTFKMG
jgi:hypothetical protein